MYKLTASQKEEVRRLTQQANRRIKSFIKVYEKAGYRLIPNEVTGGFNIQAKEEFQTKNYAISRSVKFETEKDFKRHMNKLRRFDPEYDKPDAAPTVSEYTETQREKIFTAIKSAGITLNDENIQMIENMDLIDQKKFWAEFTRRAQRMALEYSSDQLFLMMMSEYTAVLEAQREANEVVSNSAKG